MITEWIQPPQDIGVNPRRQTCTFMLISHQIFTILDCDELEPFAFASGSIFAVDDEYTVL